MRLLLTLAFCLSLAILTISIASAISAPKLPGTSLAQTAETISAQSQLADSVNADEVISSNDPRISAFEVSQSSSAASTLLEANVTLVGACAQPGDPIDSWIVVTRLDGTPIRSEKAKYTLGAIYDDFVHQHSWTDCHFSLPPSEIKLQLVNREFVRGTLVVMFNGRKLAFRLPNTQVIDDLRAQ